MLDPKNRNGKSVNPATRFSSPNAPSDALHHKNRHEKSVNPATRLSSP